MFDNHNVILWKKAKKLWDEAANKKDLFENFYKYWEGTLSDNSKEDFNVIKPIVETKTKALLDAQFTLAVKPKVSNFEDLQTIQDLQDVADVYNDEMHNVLKANNFDKIKRKVARTGNICGFSPVQTTWDTEKDVRGQIKISFISSKNLRWDKNATSLEDATYVAYKISLSPSLLKTRYCRNEDGTFNLEKCDIVDSLAEDKKEDSKDKPDNIVKRMTNFVSNYMTPQTSGQAFMKPTTNGIKNSKVVDLIVLFLLDDSLYSPEKDDNLDTQEFKQISLLKYPYGRMIIFSENDEKKVVFEDKPLDKVFCNLGNIDIYNPLETEKIEGKGEIEDLTGIQDRINNLVIKYRQLIMDDFETIMCDKASFDGNSITGNIPKAPITLISNASQFPPQSVGNSNIEKALKILEVIGQLKQSAYDLARVNETMLNGYRQTGTTSAEQVEALQESPMTEIRAQQSNFKDFTISIGEKIIALIHNNYSVQRLIKLSNSNEYAYAQIVNDPQQQDAQYIELIDKANQAVKRIKINPEWEFQIEVVAGTEIARSRKDLANFIDKLAENGFLGDMNDIDFKEMYLKFQDIPNVNAYIQLLRKKEKEAQDAKGQPMQFIDVINNPVLSKNLSDILKSLEGFSNAKSQILQQVGLSGVVDTLANAPIQETASQSDLNEVALLAPNTISQNPLEMVEAQNYGKAHALTKAAEATNIPSIENQ
jgi:hypothetical protein